MKLERLQEYLKEEELDGCILYAGDPNFRYYVQKYLMSGLLFIPAQGTPTIFVHRLEDLEHDFNVVKLLEDDTLQEYFEEKSVERAGYNPSSVNVKDYFQLKNLFGLKDVSEELDDIRMVKKDDEISNLNKAARLADDIMRNLINNFEFKTEGEIKRFIKMQMAAAGVEQSFEPIVASGRGAAVPHYFEEKKLSEGFLIIDMGVKVNGYCSDITRTFYLGEPSREEKQLYQKVLDVQKDCIKMCTLGTRCSKVYKHAKNILGEEFNHGLGHGVGLKIHELPNLKESSDRKFEDNIVFTVEPGWYDVEKEIGIRIEDDILIRNGEPERLTKTSRELKSFSLQ